MKKVIYILLIIALLGGLLGGAYYLSDGFKSAPWAKKSTEPSLSELFAFNFAFSSSFDGKQELPAFELSDKTEAVYIDDVTKLASGESSDNFNPWLLSVHAGVVSVEISYTKNREVFTRIGAEPEDRRFHSVSCSLNLETNQYDYYRDSDGYYPLINSNLWFLDLNAAGVNLSLLHSGDILGWYDISLQFVDMSSIVFDDTGEIVPPYSIYTLEHRISIIYSGGGDSNA